MTYYTYLIYVGLDDIPEEAKNNPKIYQNLLKKIVNLYQGCREDFKVGKYYCTEPGGYGCGPNEFFYSKFSDFSGKIKDTTFKIYFSFFDNTCLNVIKYRNGKKTYKKLYNYSKGIKIDEHVTIFPTFKGDDLTSMVSRNITDYLKLDYNVLDVSWKKIEKLKN